MLHLPLRTSIWLFVIIAFFHSTTAERYRCSVSKEKCVFPFEDGGVTYNECKSGVLKYWCKTDGSYGWAYCEVCEEDKTSTTSTTSTTTSTTIQPTTTSPATTTKQPTSTNSTTSTTDPPTIITKTTHLTSTVRTAPSAPTTDNIPISNTKSTIWSIPQNTTTSTPKTTTSTSSPSTTTINLADDGATAVKEVDEFLDSTTQEKDLNNGATEPSNIVREPISTEKTEDPTTVPVSTTQPTTAKVCTHSGKPCQFPFKYSGEMYYSCVEGYTYNWCYTDVSIGEYTPCIPCTESSTSTISTTTTHTTTTSATSTATTRTVAASRNVMPASSSSTKQPETLVRKVLKDPGIVKLPETVSTSSSPALSGGPVVSLSSPATTRHGIQKPADTTPLPFDNAGQLVKTVAVTQEVPALNQNGTQGYRMLSGQDTPGEPSNTKIVVIIVAIISALAALVAITILLLYIRKRRRNSKKAGAEKNGSVGESGETLLSHNKNGDHKLTNDGSSQEMKPLNSKPSEENGVDSGAGGDCDVINEKEDETTTNITV